MTVPCSGNAGDDELLQLRLLGLVDLDSRAIDASFSRHGEPMSPSGPQASSTNMVAE